MVVGICCRLHVRWSFLLSKQCLLLKNVHHLPSIGDGSPREMISLCSSSSELMECFCRISGPVSDLAMSGLGKSLNVVCGRACVCVSSPVDGVVMGEMERKNNAKIKLELLYLFA